MAVDINIQSQIVVQTAAQWAADATVYSGQRLLITSDATYTGTDQRKFKIANGVDTWANLDYFPVNTGTVDGTGSANTLPYWVDADTLGFLSTATYPDLTELSYVKGVTSAIQTQLNNKQALDSDLTAIAALSPSNDDIIQRKAGAWTNRTMAQLAADLTASNITGYQGYTLQGGQAAINPADATTYYFNRIFGSTTNTTDGRLSLYVPKAGTVKAAVVTVLHGGTAGSSETSTVSLRLNSTTDTTITSNFRTDLDATYGSVGLSIAVAQGDLLEFKWVTPTWATNPLGVSFNTIIYIE